jgi:hypothetical protein
MSETIQELREEIQKSLGLMRTLRDEIRVKMHLAGMNLKEEWSKLEPQVAEIEKAANDFSQATRKALSDAVQRLSKLRSSLS